MPKGLSEISTELQYELLGIGLITLSLLTLASFIGLNIGPVGSIAVKILRYSFGNLGAPVLPVLLMIIGSRYLWTRRGINYSLKFWGLVSLYILLLAVYHYYKVPVNQEILPDSLVPGGGLIGGSLLLALRRVFGLSGSLIVLAGLLVCSFLVATSWSLSNLLATAKRKIGDSITNAYQSMTYTWGNGLVEDFIEPDAQQIRKSKIPHKSRFSPTIDMFETDEDHLPVASHKSGIVQTPPQVVDHVRRQEEGQVLSHYQMPSLELLQKRVKLRAVKSTKEFTDNSRLLEQTLENFGVGAKVVHVCQGPAVTRYELEPSPGVKISRIVNLADDIALKLAAPGVRIEAPIPGKAAVGIEVPNREIHTVPLREVLESQEFQKSTSCLTVALGKEITGMPMLADLAKMPHLLVAGATGSGKSVCINTLIISILFKSRPDEVKFLLIDPKVVELSNYNGIPHLISPVVTDCRKAAASLRWAVQEMERRYVLFAAAGVRDIGRYNNLPEIIQLPLIVIIIDELADLMMVAPVDVEDAICRLAQMARAAGLHLVLATQRPSVDVITGTIKANIPSRISFAVSSQVDSRTILDMGGAEKLLGKGDMLYYPVGAAKPVRVQGAFIADREVEDLVDYLKQQSEPEYTEGVTFSDDYGEKKPRESLEDDLLEDAVRMVLETGQASVSMLQRKFRIGYTRAARLIDTIEEMGIIGPHVGSKAREILMTTDQVYARFFRPQS